METLIQAFAKQIVFSPYVINYMVGQCWHTLVFLTRNFICIVFLNLQEKSKESQSGSIKESKVSALDIPLACAILTVSNISRVCAAETQNRARASARGVAGNPTTTTPIFLFNKCLAKALKERQKKEINWEVTILCIKNG